ncbi:MAG: TraR/DksA C4-type zinc finger protein [Rhodospirillales bacterium]
MEENEVRTALAAELEELIALQTASAESRAPVELDQATQGRLSRMDALQVQAMALETQRRRELRRSRILATLDRLEAGEFGACVLCGEEIEPKRLAVDPTSPTCVDCAR